MTETARKPQLLSIHYTLALKSQTASIFHNSFILATFFTIFYLEQSLQR